MLAWWDNLKREMEPTWREARRRGWEMEFRICFFSLEWDITPGKLRTRQHTKLALKVDTQLNRDGSKEIETTQKLVR